MPRRSASPGRETLRSLSRARLAIAVFFFVNGATVGEWVPHIPDRARALRLNPAQLGAVLLAGGIGAVLAMPLAAWLTARVGSRRVSTVAGTMFPVALTGAILAPSVLTATLALLICGVSGASMDVAMNSQGVLVEERLGRRTMSVFHGVYSLGGVVGSAATGAAMARRVPTEWLAGVTAAVLAGMVLAASCWMLPHREEWREERVSERPHAIRPHGRLLLLGVLAFASMVSEGAVADWSALFLRVVRGLGRGVVGFGFTAFSAAMVAGRFTGDWTVGHLGEKWALRAGGLVGIAGLLLALFGPGAAASIGGFALLGIGLANSSPVLYRAAGQMKDVPPGVGIATTVGIGYAGLLAGPPTLGFIGHAVGIRSIFLTVTGLCLLLAVAAPLVCPPPVSSGGAVE